MKLLARTVAVLFVLIGLFLIAAVINAVFSSGAKTGVAILYVVVSIVLFIGAQLLLVYAWRARRRVADEPPTTTPRVGATPT